MNVSLECFARLVKEEGCDYRDSTAHELPPGARITNLIDKLGFRAEEIKLVFANHVIVPQTTPLHEGDRVACAPATGGM